MNNMWDSRYDTEEFVYGREPNVFFARSLGPVKPGKILLPGEGEGRNAVYAASLGWQVQAFDQSRIGAEKAKSLAREMGVEISYEVCDIQEFSIKEGTYDAVGLVYFHLPPPMRKEAHMKLVSSLKPGGILILEAFHKTQLGRKSGGPPNLELLLSKEMIEEDFGGLEIVLLEETEVDLDEGLFHGGAAKVLRFLGRKNITKE